MKQYYRILISSNKLTLVQELVRFTFEKNFLKRVKINNKSITIWQRVPNISKFTLGIQFGEFCLKVYIIISVMGFLFV